MLDQRVHIGEDAQGTAVAVEDVSRTSSPLDRIAQLSTRRLAAIFDLDDFLVAEMVADSLGQVGAYRYPRSIDGENGCSHDVGSSPASTKKQSGAAKRMGRTTPCDHARSIVENRI